jgi:carbamoylphosphate synthase large subunit
MNKVLLVDTNRSAVPLYKYLIKEGYDVSVVGRDPDETLARLADKYIQLDYSDINGLKKLIENEKFDYLVPGCTDTSYRACSEVNEVNGCRYFNIDTLENFHNINEKQKFRQVAEQHGLPVPRLYSKEEALKAGSIIVKPVDSFSGRGIQVLNYPDAEDLDKAYKHAQSESICGSAIIEEYISGQLYSHSAFVSNNIVVSDFIVQEDCTLNPYAVDTSRLAFNFPNEILQSLRRDISKLSNSLNLVDGLIHTQFIFTDGRYWIIEMTRRCPGDIYSLLIEYSTGYQYAASYVAPFVNKVPMSNKSDTECQYIVRHTIGSDEPRRLWGIKFSGSVEIHLLVPLLVSGGNIEKAPSGRVGIIFLRASSLEDQDLLYEKCLSGSLYEYG